MNQHKSQQEIFLKEHGSQLDADWERVSRFYFAARLTSRLVAPRPLKKLPHSHQIAYQKLDCSRPIFDEARANSAFFKQFGTALFELHAATNTSTATLDQQAKTLTAFGLSDSQAIALINSFPCGTCHGDCWHGNVFCLEDSRFIVLDPIPAPLMSELMPDNAPGCIDLAYLCASLFLGHRLLCIPTLDPSLLNNLGEMAIAGYITEANVNFPTQAFNALCMRISELWIEQFAIRLAYPIRVGKTLAKRRLIKKAFFAGN